MRSKAPLVLMEQMVMLLVFALAAALCLQAFVKSDQISRRNEGRDRAAVLCQSAAEVIRHTGGDFSKAAGILGAQLWEKDSLLILYGEDWQPAQPDSPGVYPMGYTLGIGRAESGAPGLGLANVWVRDDAAGDEEEFLFSLEVTWQTALDSAIPQEDKDRALAEARTLAAELRQYRGDPGASLAGESDGLGGWRRYFSGTWEPESSRDNAVYELRYSQGKVEALWNQTGTGGAGTGVKVSLCTVGLEEVTDRE